MTMLAKNYPERIAKVREIASNERLPEKFVELTFLDLKKAGQSAGKNAGKKAGKHAAMFESLRGTAPRISDRTSLADLCCSRNN